MNNKLLRLTKLLLLVVACCLSLSTEAQTTAINGIITDVKGEPLIGATVMIKKSDGGLDRGTTSDINGKFSLNATPGQVLFVSYIGYANSEIGVTNQKSYIIRLNEEDTTIEEVVVVGYGTQKRVNLTGAVSSIDSKQFEGRPIVSATVALQGLAPGVTVTTHSGSPGADGGAIRIRGINSFGGSSTSPLVLIDGIEGNMNSIEPSLIESVSILKDAASASIYGSRAANGVILITTKRGSKENLSISYKGYMGWQSPTALPNNVNAYEHRLLSNRTSVNDGDKPLYSDEEMNLYLKNMGKDADLYPNTDWQDAILQGSGFTHNHDITLTTGGDRVSMLTSLGYTDQEGIIKNTGFQRYTFRNNADVKFNKKLSLKLDLSFSTSNREVSPYQGTIFNYMNTRSADIPNEFTTGLSNGLGLGGLNPVALMQDGGQNQTNTLRLNGAITLIFKPITWLTLEGKLAPRYTTTNQHNFKIPVKTYSDAQGTSTLTSAPYHTLTESGSRSFYGNYNFVATLDKDFKSHNVKLILGAERNTYDYKYLNAYRQGFSYPDYDQIDAGEIENMNNGGRQYQWAIQSYFGRINYNYQDRYLIEANLRIDGSSRFIASNRWGYFPSVSTAWRISEEPFMAGAKSVIDGLKLRASYGTLGNQNLAGSDAASYYPTSPNLATGQFAMGNKIYPLVTLNTMANPDIKWETTTMADVGIDFLLFEKFSVTADWYRKMTSGILMTLDVSPTIGLSAPFQNAGKVRNTGWEIGINYSNRWKDVSLSVGANLSDVKNEITDMQGRTATSGVMRNQEGYSIGSIYALKSLGLIQTQEEADWINTNCPQYNQTVHPGDIHYADIDNSSTITDDDRTIIGNTVPRYTYSFNTNIGWKGFQLGLFFQGVGKVDGYLNYSYVFPNYMGGTYRDEYLDSWSEDNTKGTMPRLSATNNNNWKDSSFWMKSAAYLRLKNIQLGYELPKSLMRKIGVESFFVYVNAQNLFTSTKFWQGYDPELAYGGDASGDFDAISLGGASAASNYPQVKTYTVGINLKF